MTVAVMSNKEWTALTRALDRPEWLDDPRFKTPALRDQNINDRLQLTQDVLKTRTTEDWLERLEAEGVPCAPVLTRDQVISHPQVRASNHPAWRASIPSSARLRQTRAAARFSKTPPEFATAPRCCGEHTTRPCWRSSVCRTTTIEALSARASSVAKRARPDRPTRASTPRPPRATAIRS